MDYIEQNQSEVSEVCHFCVNPGLYWGMNDDRIVSLCKKHIVLEASS